MIEGEGMEIDNNALKELIQNNYRGTVNKKLVNQNQVDSQSELLSLSYLSDCAQQTIKRSEEMGLAVTVSVVDMAGNLVFCYRMKNAILASIKLSQKKAYSAIAMNQDTASLAELCQPGADLYQLETVTGGNVVSFGGGLLLKNASHCWGGLGISGAPKSQQDVQLGEYFKQVFFGGIV